MQTVQVLRQRAEQAGNLQSTPQEDVTNDQGYVQLAPANPQVVYVPTYDPWTVYGPPISPYPGFSFVGALGSFFGSMCHSVRARLRHVGLRAHARSDCWRGVSTGWRTPCSSITRTTTRTAPPLPIGVCRMAGRGPTAAIGAGTVCATARTVDPAGNGQPGMDSRPADSKPTIGATTISAAIDSISAATISVEALQ